VLQEILRQRTVAASVEALEVRLNWAIWSSNADRAGAGEICSFDGTEVLRLKNWAWAASMVW